MQTPSTEPCTEPKPVDALVDAYDRGQLSRRALIGRLTALAGLAAVTGPAIAQQAAGGVTTATTTAAPPTPTFAATDVNHIALAVPDVERSAAFYQRHLGLTVTSQSRSSCFLRCGQRDFLALFRREKPGMDHYCFSIDDFDAGRAVTRLNEAGLAPRRRGDRVYFDDPDGLEVQVAATAHGV